jgi:AcrR family transcriptional regulator
MTTKNNTGAILTKPLTKPLTKLRPAKPTSTRDRIIERSIALFNKRGLQYVAIDHIASDLKISPGNLTYHFKRKHDLILATLAVLQKRLNLALEQTQTARSAEESAAYLVSIFRTFWDFRFFFNALTFLLTNDTDLRKEYFAFRDRALQTIEDDINGLRERGFFHAANPPNNFRLLAENMWSQWLDWLRMQQMKNPLARTPALYECALHHWSLSEPFLEPKFAVDLLQAYQRLLLKKTS